MMIPIRCWSCGKPIADKYEQFTAQTSQGKNPSEVLEEVGLSRYCCRRMFVSQADLMGEIKPYKRY